MEQRIKLIISYDGTDFLGWQHSGMGPKTVEGSLLIALEKIFNQTLRLEAASRTDTGVHAKKQVVAFSFSGSSPTPGQLRLSLNQMLPKSIRVLSAQPCPLEFHPSKMAKAKRYSYYLSLGLFQHPFERLYSWHVLAPFCLATLKEATGYFLGSHDFRAFTNQGSVQYEDYRRTIFSIDVTSESAEKIRIDVCGDRFTYKMVRNIIGTLVYVGKKMIDPESVESIIAGKIRANAGPTAPAKGLFLDHVYYETLPTEVTS